MGRATLSKTLVWRAAALVGGLVLGVLSYPVNAAPTSGGDTVQSLYDALLSTMKNARTLGQSGRFTQLAPVIRRTFDIASMTRLSVGSTWAGLSEAQRQQLTESFGRYISAIYADRFDSYAGQKLQVTGEQPNPGGVMVKSTVVSQKWETEHGVFITAEGLLMYLQPDDALRLIAECAARFPGGQMMFDLPPALFASWARRGMRTGEVTDDWAHTEHPAWSPPD